jgi:hypothetical protein
MARLLASQEFLNSTVAWVFCMKEESFCGVLERWRDSNMGSGFKGNYANREMGDYCRQEMEQDQGG